MSFYVLVGKDVVKVEDMTKQQHELFFNTKTNPEQIDSNVVVFQNPNPEVPHKTYTLAMSRKAHRYACLKTAQQVGEIDWKYTENDWTVLKASNNVEGTMYVTVRMAIPVTEYERRVREYNRLTHARIAKQVKRDLIHDIEVIHAPIKRSKKKGEKK